MSRPTLESLLEEWRALPDERRKCVLEAVAFAERTERISAANNAPDNRPWIEIADALNLAGRLLTEAGRGGK